MKPPLLDHLRDPSTGEHLRLEVYARDGQDIREGRLVDSAGYWYPIVEGVPCLLRGSLRPCLEDFEKRHGLEPTSDAPPSAIEDEQRDTTASFSDKWRRLTRWGLEGAQNEFLMEWYRKKFGLADNEALDAFYAEQQSVLEVGTGSGFHVKYMAEHGAGEVFGVDISEAAHTTYANVGHVPNVHVVRADLMALPFEDESFDLVVADGVLHHTPDTRRAVRALYDKVRSGGRFFFYVYKRMGALREFADDHVRSVFSKLTSEECYRACEAITVLGRELSRLEATVTLEEPIDVLGIPAGSHDVQRLFYYNVLKCFWNEAFDFETNNMVNFDWYHPRSAWRHDQEEIEGWLHDLGATEYAFHPANPNGHSVLVRKQR